MIPDPDAAKTVLVAGTYDTKGEELAYLSACIRAQGGRVLSMDVSVLGEPKTVPDIPKHRVAEAGGGSIRAAIDGGDENAAMQIMAKGAVRLARGLHDAGRIDAVIALGGTMGTDLALDLCAALPLGVPKYIVSTVSFSPMLPPERLAADIQMILWAGGLYGLNSVCKSSLSQAAGAVLGAARAVEPPRHARPLIGMTSFGASILHYMIALKPALEARGFEVAVFHATGMGGRAFESLAAEGAFACVMDFATQEIVNHHMGSGISAGADRMTNAGRRGIPQIIAPACYDLVDLIGWQPIPPRLQGRVLHAHNRLLTSALLTTEERIEVAALYAAKLAGARGPTAFVLPAGGCNEWDRAGGPLHDSEGLAAFCAAMERMVPANITLHRLECHINDAGFTGKVLEIFDDWLARGIVRR